MSTYTKVCSAKTEREMLCEFDALLSACVKKFGGTKKSHRQRQLSNVGYIAGYYDNKTMERVNRWLKAAHPIFGSRLPDAKQAYNIGRRKA